MACGMVSDSEKENDRLPESQRVEENNKPMPKDTEEHIDLNKMPLSIMISLVQRNPYRYASLEDYLCSYEFWKPGERYGTVEEWGFQLN